MASLVKISPLSVEGLNNKESVLLHTSCEKDRSHTRSPMIRSFYNCVKLITELSLSFSMGLGLDVLCPYDACPDLEISTILDVLGFQKFIAGVL